MHCTSHRPFGRAVLLSLAAGSMLACATPVVVYRPAAAALAEERGRRLELRLTTGERYMVDSARVQNDTLYGVRLASSPAEGVQIAVPVRGIASLTKTEYEISAGAAGVIGLVLGAIVLLTAIVTPYGTNF